MRYVRNYTDLRKKLHLSRDEAGLRVPVAIPCFRGRRPLSGVGGIDRSSPVCRERPICVRACVFGRKYSVRRIKCIRIGARITSMRKRGSNDAQTQK